MDEIENIKAAQARRKQVAKEATLHYADGVQMLLDCDTLLDEIERLRTALKKALPVLEDVAAGGRILTSIDKRKEARAAVSQALAGGIDEQQLPKEETT